MKKKFKLGIIGGGFMAQAIVNGIIKSKALKSRDMIITDHHVEKLDYFSKLKVNTTLNSDDILNNSEFLLLAVKPQSFNEFASKISFYPDKIISIMAGVKKQKIKSFFPDCLVARCMPNTPCSIGKGVVGLDVSDFNDKNDVDFIFSIFNGLSKVVCVEEEKLATVTAISGSSPAYFYLFAQSLINQGVKNGLSFNQAKELVVNTMIGSGEMINYFKDKDIGELINNVCSKGGTTIQAVESFKNDNLDKTVENAVLKCINRAKELENL